MEGHSPTHRGYFSHARQGHAVSWNCFSSSLWQAQGAGAPPTAGRTEAQEGTRGSPRSRGSHIADVTLKSTPHPPTRLLTLGPAATEKCTHHRSLVTISVLGHDLSDPGRTLVASAKAPASERGCSSEHARHRQAKPTPGGPRRSNRRPRPLPRPLPHP